MSRRSSGALVRGWPKRNEAPKAQKPRALRRPQSINVSARLEDLFRVNTPICTEKPPFLVNVGLFPPTFDPRSEH